MTGGIGATSIVAQRDTRRRAKENHEYRKAGSSRLIYWIGIAVFSWYAVRAQIQSITIDEADTYLVWVARTEPSHWLPGSNNHVLNSLLMRATSTVFGVNHLGIRLPALLGAATYLAACVILCQLLFSDRVMRAAVFITLACNPFVADYMVAGRGYSLALACLALEFVCGARILEDVRQGHHYSQVNRLLAVCSLCAGLGFSANFSFAFVHAAALGFIVLLVLRQRWSLRALMLATVPGAIAVLMTCSSILAGWRNVELIYGAQKISEMLKSVYQASFGDLNRFIVNPVLLPWLRKAPALLVTLLLACSAAVLLLVWRSRRAGAYPEREPALAFATLAAAVLAATLAAHAGMHYVAGFLLPMGRTALFIAFLVPLIAGCAAELRLGRAVPILRYAPTGLKWVMTACAVYFLMSGRLTYFREWRFDADCRQTYDHLAYYYGKFGISTIESSWKYRSCLEFYSAASGAEDFHFVDRGDRNSGGQRAYVLSWLDEEAFIRREDLAVRYRGPRSDVVIAIDPKLTK